MLQRAIEAGQSRPADHGVCTMTTIETALKATVKASEAKAKAEAKRRAREAKAAAREPSTSLLPVVEF